MIKQKNCSYDLYAEGYHQSPVLLGSFVDKNSAIEELDRIQSAIDYGDNKTTIVEISQPY